MIMVMAMMLAIATALLSFFSVDAGYVGIGSGLCSLIENLLIHSLTYIISREIAFGYLALSQVFYLSGT
jgi:hypothetical protein